MHEHPLQSFTEALEGHQYAYLTTSGRLTGQPHRIEIWFCVVEGRVWMISGGRRRSDWVRNLLVEPAAQLEIGEARWRVRVEEWPDSHHPARERLAGRYQGWRSGDPLTSWAIDGLLLAFDHVT